VWFFWKGFDYGLPPPSPLLTQLCGRDAPQVGLALRPTARPLMSPHDTPSASRLSPPAHRAVVFAESLGL
jgi:hypothetical protein